MKNEIILHDLKVSLSMESRKWTVKGVVLKQKCFTVHLLQAVFYCLCDQIYFFVRPKKGLAASCRGYAHFDPTHPPSARRILITKSTSYSHWLDVGRELIKGPSSSSLCNPYSPGQTTVCFQRHQLEVERVLAGYSSPTLTQAVVYGLLINISFSLSAFSPLDKIYTCTLDHECEV